MALVKFVKGDSVSFSVLEAKDNDTLYFITDERRIYKGETPYGCSFTAVSEFPPSGEINTLYVNTSDGAVKYWNGESYQDVIKPSEAISGSGDKLTLATTKAVVDYVTKTIQDMDMSAVTNRISALETKVTTIQGSGEGSINKALQDAKDYADGLASNYAPASHEHTLSNITDAGALAAKDNIEEVDFGTTLSGTFTTLKSDVSSNKEKVTTLEGKVSTLETSVGTVGNLQTSEKTNLVGAVNEVVNTVNANKTAGAVTVDTGSTTEGYLKSYTIKQGGSTIGTIDIPKDLVVTSGEVVTNPEDQAPGTYIKLVIANQEAPLYINVATLVDAYTAEEGASQVQIAITPENEISATIVAGSVTATELSENAVTTAKIADGNVTKAKLETTVQTSLDRADSAVQDIITGVTNGTIKVDGKEIAVSGLGSAAYENANAFENAGAATIAETNAKAYADGLNTTMDSRVDALETAVGTGGTVDSKINAAIAELDVTDTAVSGQYVSQVSETDGKIIVVRTDLPVKSVTEGGANGTIAVNGSDIAVHGLGSAAYANTAAFDTSGSAAQALIDAKSYTDTALTWGTI